MKSCPILALALAFTCFIPALRAETQTGTHAYLQASGILADPGEDFTTATGGALAIGVSFKRNHAIEVEGIAFTSEGKKNVGYFYGGNNSIRFQYLFLTYRYTYSLTEHFKLFAAASAGGVNVKYKIWHSYYNYVYHSSESDKAGAGAAQIGCAYEFNSHSAVTLTNKAVFQGNTHVTTSGSFSMFQFGYRHTF